MLIYIKVEIMIEIQVKQRPQFVCQISWLRRDVSGRTHSKALGKGVYRDTVVEEYAKIQCGQLCRTGCHAIPDEANIIVYSVIEPARRDQFPFCGYKSAALRTWK